MRKVRVDCRPVRVGRHIPHLVAVVLVEIAEVDDVLAEVDRHEQDSIDRHLPEVFDRLDVEIFGEGVGAASGDAVRDHRKPERLHCWGWHGAPVS